MNLASGSATHDGHSNRRVVIFGGYGVFGTHVARRLSTEGLQLTIAGRNRERAERFARSMGDLHRAIQVDIRDPSECAKILREHDIAVNCAGPFHDLGTALVDACVESNCHYVDISDDRRYTQQVRCRDADFKSRGLLAVYGCSSLPGISGCAADDARHRSDAPIVSIRITLFIGNDNPKGIAAVTSAANLLGRSISTPQGRLVGFRQPERIEFPPAIGPQTGLNFESPEYDLFPSRYGSSSVIVKVAFEARLVRALFRGTARLMPGVGRWLLPRCAMLGSKIRLRGNAGGAVIAEMFDSENIGYRTTVFSVAHGQRMAIMPCVYVIRQLCNATPTMTGAMTAYELCGSSRMLKWFETDGYQVWRQDGD